MSRSTVWHQGRYSIGVWVVMQCNRTKLWQLVLISSIIISSSSVLQAQPNASVGPWDKLATRAQQQRARKIYREGAKLHNQLLYAQAVAKYQDALAHWKHPDIHFNLARALIPLRDPLGAYENLLQAIRFGPISLRPKDYQLALKLKEILSDQLATIDVRCDEPGAVVTIGFDIVALAGGRGTKWVLPGAHQIVASKAGYLDDEKFLVLQPGERRVITLKPMSERAVAWADLRCDEPGAEVTLNGKPLMRCPGAISQVLVPNQQHIVIISRLGHVTTQETLLLAPGERTAVALKTLAVPEFTERRRWKPWKPWAVVGAGVIAALIGAGLEWQAVREFNDFDMAWSNLCEYDERPGCLEREYPNLINDLSRARWMQRMGIGSIVLGSTTVLVGFTMVIINQPQQSLDGIGDSPRVAVESMTLPTAFSIATGFVF